MHKRPALSSSSSLPLADHVAVLRMVAASAALWAEIPEGDAKSELRAHLSQSLGKITPNSKQSRTYLAKIMLGELSPLELAGMAAYQIYETTLGGRSGRSSNERFLSYPPAE